SFEDAGARHLGERQLRPQLGRPPLQVPVAVLPLRRRECLVLGRVLVGGEQLGDGPPGGVAAEGAGVDLPRGLSRPACGVVAGGEALRLRLAFVPDVGLIADAAARVLAPDDAVAGGGGLRHGGGSSLLSVCSLVRRCERLIRRMVNLPRSAANY